MRWVKRALGLVLVGLLLVTSAAAQQQEPKRPSARLIFANGVCFLYDTTLTTSDGRPTLAGAYERPLPCPAIIINPNIARDVPEPVLLWIILHELVHLSKSHSVYQPFDVRKEQEAEADCEGARWLRRLWPDLADSLGTMVQEYLQPGPMHGSPEERARRVAQCARPE